MTETGKIRTFPLPQPAEDKPVRKTKSNKVSPSTPELAEEELAAKFVTMNQEAVSYTHRLQQKAFDRIVLLARREGPGTVEWVKNGSFLPC